MAAYKKIMEALYDLKKSNNYFYSKYMETTYFDEETNSNERTINDITNEDDLFRNKLKEAREEIEKITSIEGIFLGVETVKSLKDLLVGFETIKKESTEEWSEPEYLYTKEFDLIEIYINEIKN